MASRHERAHLLELTGRSNTDHTAPLHFPPRPCRPSTKRQDGASNSLRIVLSQLTNWGVLLSMTAILWKPDSELHENFELSLSPCESLPSAALLRAPQEQRHLLKRCSGGNLPEKCFQTHPKWRCIIVTMRALMPGVWSVNCW